jgi:hypothetical protein
VSDPIDTSLDNCGCCEPDPVPLQIYNRPGLPALAYRAGTYATFYRRMLAELGRYILPDGDLAGSRPLLALTTREADDPSIALLDASAVVADVLTFYQERIANEGFLRTAVERRSILELARAIGYELNPGVAASVYLAFSIEDAMGAPGEADIPAGTKVQSVPPQGQLPQTFETSADISARAEWNALRPRLSTNQNVVTGVSGIYVSGTSTNLKAGDVVLVTSGVYSDAVHVASVETDDTTKLTHLVFEKAAQNLGGVPGSIGMTVWGDQKIPFNATNVLQQIQQKTWKDADLNAFLKYNEWDPETLVEYLQDYRLSNPSTTGWAYALRARLGIFGNNAPRYDTLPASLRFGEWGYFDNTDSTKWVFKPAVYLNSWEGRGITTDSQGTAYPTADFFFEKSVSALLPGTWMALESPAASVGMNTFKITETVEAALSDYAINAKVTGVKVGFGSSLSGYTVRETTAYAQADTLTLAELPKLTDLAAGQTQLELDGLVLGLGIGQALILTGERTDAPGMTASEVLTVKDIQHNYGFTTLTFESGPVNPFKRSTVAINANVAPATHGETVTEILGSGDGAGSNQRFSLKKPPLTYTAAPTPSGSTSSLQLRVNNLLWSESASLYPLGPKDQDYIVRIDDDAKATVIFGDGRKGARLPTGVNNVVATYRSGIGLAGEVAAGSLSMLMSKPLGVRGVTNPLPAGGAADPEKMEDARSHAPLTVRTLDRVVSPDDYQDFAGAFAGIGKAQALDLWQGEHHLVYVTIGGADGEPVIDPKFILNFTDALDGVRDPAQLVMVDTFDLRLFNLTASIAVDGRYISADVLAAAQAALIEAFAFARRGFGQSVTAAEVMTVIQNVPGVVFVDLVWLYPSKDVSQSLKQLLTANTAFVDAAGNIHRAQLLLINTLGIILQEVQP